MGAESVLLLLPDDTCTLLPPDEDFSLVRQKEEVIAPIVLREAINPPELALLLLAWLTARTGASCSDCESSTWTSFS
jgi:hypothetical protein